MGYSVDQALEDRKKREEQESNQRTYEWEGQRNDVEAALAERATRITSEVDANYINTFMLDVSNFFSNSQTDWDGLNWGNATNSSSNLDRNTTWGDIYNRVGVLRSYANLNKDQMGEESYNQFMSYLDSIEEGGNGIITGFNDAYNFYSQWETEDEYNEWSANQKDKDEKLNADLGTLELELGELQEYKNCIGILMKYSMTNDYTSVTKEEVDYAISYCKTIESKYGITGDTDLNQMISDKELYLNDARRLQEWDKLSAVSNNADFDQYSGYVSTEIDGFWGKATSQYGMGYDDLTYEYINGDDSMRSDIRWKGNGYNNDRHGPSLQWQIYDYMTEDEIAIYNYHYAKNGKEAADKYLDSIRESLNYRQAGVQFENIEGNTMLELFFGIAAGLDQFESGIKGSWNAITGNDEYTPPSTTQIVSGMIREDLSDDGPALPVWMGGSSLGQVGYDAITTIANVAPSMIIGAAAGGAWSIAGKAFGAGVLGTSAAGNAYQEAINLGYGKDHAGGYALLVGASEAGLEFLLGGISSLGGTSELIEKILNGVDNAFAHTALKLGGSMLSEGFEEGLQEILTPYFKNLALHADSNVNWNEVAYSSLLGALTAGIMEGPGTIAGGVKNYKTGKSLQAAGISAERLAEIGSTFSADTVAYQLAGMVDENTGAYTLGRLFNEINATLSEQNINEITNALVAKGMDEKTAKANAKALAYVVEGGQLSEAQIAIIEGNEVLAEVAKDVLIDENTPWNQRSKGHNEVLKALADEVAKSKASKTKQAQQTEEKSVVEGEITTEAKTLPESKYEVSADGKTRDLDGNEIVIKGVESIKDGKMILKTEDSTIDASEVFFSSNDALVYSAVADMDVSAETAWILIKGFKESDGVSAQKYAIDIPLAYKYGKLNYKAGLKNLDLTAEQAMTAFYRGRNDADAEVKANVKAQPAKATEATESTKATVSEKNADKKIIFEGFKYNEKTAKPLQKASIAAIDIINKMTSLEVHVYQSYKKNGKYYAVVNGKTRIAPNGYFQDGNKIYIDINAGQNGQGAMLFTMAHEVGHYIAREFASEFKVISDFLFEHYGENVPVDEMLEAQKQKRIKSYEADGKPIPSDAVLEKEAHEELVCDMLSNMFADERAFDKLMELKQRDLNAFQKLGEAIKKLLNKLNNLINAYKNQNPDFMYAASVENFGEEAFRQLQDLYMKAFVQADANYQSREATTTEALAEAGIGFDEDTNTVYALRDSLAYNEILTVGRKNFDIDAIAGLVSKATGRSIADAKKWVKSELTIANIIMANPEFLDFDPDNRYDAIKKNSDYPQGTVDLSNLCPKREEFTTMFDMLQKKYPNKLFTAQDVAEMRKILSENGITVACGACFVEDRRQLIGEIADTYINMWKEAVETGKPLQKTNASGVKSDLLVTKALAKQYGLTAGTKIMATDTYIPNQYDLTTYEGFKLLEKNHPTIAMGFNRYNNSRGQQSARLIEGRAEYKRQILGWSDAQVRRVNNNGGLRIFSFSDFEVVHMLDLVQVIIDCAAKGVKIQGYTKIPAFAKLVRNTGVKLNRSHIPSGDLGYHMENGKVVLDCDTKEGIDTNDKNFLDEDDNPNVGDVIIGINPTQIAAAMLDNFFDYIIPFHSNKAKAILEKLGTGKWVNYKESQHEKDISTGTSSKHNVNIYTQVINKYHPTNKVEFVDAFLNECKKQGKIPRYAEFLNKEYKADGAYQDEGGAFDYTYREGYHKLLVDFKMFDKDGNILPQGNITPILDDVFMAELLESEVDRKQSYEFPQEVYDAIDKQFGETKFSDRDSDYLDAVNRGDMETAQKMVDEFAKMAGYPVKAYHGTPSFGFTKFDPAMSDDKTTLFFTDDIKVASTYAGRDVRNVKNVSEAKSFKYEKGKTYTEAEIREAYDVVQAKYRVYGEIKVNEEKQTLSHAGHRYSAKTVMELADSISKEGIYGVYLNTDNVLEVDSGYAGWSFLKNPEVDEWRYKINYQGDGEFNYFKAKADDMFLFELLKNGETVHNGTIRFSEMASTLRKAIGSDRTEMAIRHATDGSGMGSSRFNTDYSDKNGNYAKPTMNTREMAQYAKKKGYDGVTIKNLKDWGGKNAPVTAGFAMDRKGAATIYILFDSNRVKSADPVTYDDSGNVIPLSQRFNVENDDIRYSDRDSEGNQLSKAQQEFFKDSKVRWGDNIMPVHHGTYKKFTVFDTTAGYDENRVGGLLWAAKDAEYAKGFTSLYEPVIMKGYLNITKMLDIGDIDSYENYESRLQELADIVGLTPSELEAMATYDDPVKYIYDITSSKGFRDRIVELGYDGVTALESGLQTFGFVDSNQFKNIDNLNPTTDPDVRYSDRVLMGSLFSGGGTLEAGLVYQMLDKEFAVEYNKQIAATYTDNHGKEHMFVGDVRDFNSKDKQNVFYLHASPVCKSYSPANHSGGEKTLDIVTAQATARVLEEQMPQVFTVENVKRYIGSEAYKLITDKLTELGYTWDVGVYKASDYGNATKRERMIIRAVKDGNLPAKPAKASGITSWGEATRDLWDTDLIPSYLVKSKIEAIRNTPALKDLKLTKLDKPLMIYDTTKSKQVTYAWADELAPTLTTKCGDARIIMPDGRVYEPTPKFMGRIQGLPDDYKYPKAKTNAFKIIGNGIPTQLTRAVMGGVLDSAYEQTHDGQVLYQDRTDDSVSNRSLLANAFESVAKNDIERNKIQEYKSKIDLINSEEQKLGELNERIKELSFAKGPRDTKAIRDLQIEAKQTANRISTYDKQLLRLEASKPLQDVLAREKKLAYQRAEKKGKQALEEYREKAANTQRVLLEKWQESRKKGIDSRNRTAMRHKIKDVVNELNQYLLRGTKDRHVPIELQKAVAEALDAVNMDTVGAEERIAKLQAELMKAKTPEQIQEISRKIDHIQEMGDKMNGKLQKLKDAYDQFINSDDPMIANSHDEVISNKLQSVIDSIGNTPLRDMTLAQLEDVYDMYRMVLTTIRNANKAFKLKKSESISIIANRVMEEVEKVGGKKKLSWKGAEGIKSFDWNNLKPVYAFERIGSGTLTEVFNNVRTGEDTWAVDVREAIKYYLDKSNKYGYDSWDFNKRYKFESTSGMEFELSLEQIMSLYAFSKREQAAEHLKKGGIVFDETTEVTVKSKLGIPLKFNPTEATAYNLSDEILSDIVSKLSKEQKGFVDDMQDYLSTVMGAKGNEVSLELYGIKLFKEKFYFPLKSATQFMAKAKEQQQGEVKVKNKGFSKETVQKASNPIVLTPFMDVWADHVNEMSMYHAFVLPMEDFYRVYNYKTPTSDTLATESVEMFIQNAYGKAATKYIDQLLKDLNGGAMADPRETFAKAMTAKFKKAKVFSSMSVVIQQFSAIGRAFALIDPKYFRPTKTGMKHTELWEELKQYAPVAVIKEMGYFDTNMGRSTRDFIKAKEYHGIKEKAKALVTDSGYRDEALSKLPALADEITWCAIWNAVKRETVSTHKDLRPGSEEFLKVAGERFTEVVTKTQVYDSVLARSANMRSKSGLMSMMTSFMAETTTSINMIEDAILKAKRGDKRYAAKAVASVLTSIILNNALVSIVYAMRDDDEDETFLEKYLSAFVSGTLDDLNPITYYPYLKDVWSLLQGYSVERSDMSLISDLADTAKGLVKAYTSEDGDVAGAWLDFAGAIANIGGIPMQNIRREIDGTINFVNTIIKDVNGRQTTLGSLGDVIQESVQSVTPVWGWFPGETKGDKLYDAIIRGDTTYVERLKAGYKDDKAYTSAIRKALRENDPRIHDAAVARMNGDLDEYTRIAKEIIGEKNFSQDDVVAAINAEINALDNEETTSSAPKASGLYTADDFGVAIAQGDSAMANAIKTDIIQTAEKNGKSPDEAEDSFISSAKTNLKEMFLAGELSENEVIDALVTYCDMDEDEAFADVRYWEFKNDNPDVYVDDAWIDEYYDEVAYSGISLDVFVDYRNRVKGITGEGKKERRMAIINSLPITNAQKDALYLAEGWTESRLYEAPWH